MRLSPALVLAALTGTALAVAPVSAQGDTDDAPAQAAAFARAALERPEDPETWNGLAESLPELAFSERADVAGVFAATRLADSMATAPLLPTDVLNASRFSRTDVLTEATDQAVGEEGPVAFSETLRARTAAIGGDLVTWLQAGWDRIRALDAGTLWTVAPWAAVALILGFGFVARRRVAGRVRRANRKRDSRKRPAMKAGKERRAWTVTTLAESGLPPAEIARRTGMAQDAVHVLLGLRNDPRAPASRKGRGSQIPGLAGTPIFAPAGPSVRPPSLGEQAAGISTARVSLAREAKALKGGRLTYGPGSVA